jgi:hypothetical protein
MRSNRRADSRATRPGLPARARSRALVQRVRPRLNSFGFLTLGIVHQNSQPQRGRPRLNLLVLTPHSILKLSTATVRPGAPARLPGQWAGPVTVVAAVVRGGGGSRGRCGLHETMN